MPNAEIKNNNKININPPASKSSGAGEEAGTEEEQDRDAALTRRKHHSCMIPHVPTHRHVEVSTGLAVNNSLVSISSSHS